MYVCLQLEHKTAFLRLFDFSNGSSKQSTTLHFIPFFDMNGGDFLLEARVIGSAKPQTSAKVRHDKADC